MRRCRTTAALIATLIALSACIPPPAPQPRTLPTARLYLPLLAMPTKYGQGAALTHSSAGDPCADLHTVNAAWGYNWSNSPPACYLTPTFPMLWDRPTAPTPLACPELSPAPLALLWNEPSQMTPPLTPTEAITLTHWVIEQCNAGRYYASPAEIATDSRDGLDWMSAWWDGYADLYQRTPLVEVMAYHCYTWRAANVCMYRLQAALLWAKAHQMRGVLVTEWAVIPRDIGAARAQAEADLLREWMEQQPGILGHAFFATRIQGDEPWAFKPHPAATTSLLDPVTGELTPLGAWYASRP